jgi:hypothetical protein
MIDILEGSGFVRQQYENWQALPSLAKPYPSEGIIISEAGRLEDLQLEVYVRDACD